ncbi:hypothetical protein KCF3NO3_25200 [Chryseobacterium sp. KCF3-3]
MGCYVRSKTELTGKSTSPYNPIATVFYIVAIYYYTYIIDNQTIMSLFINKKIGYPRTTNKLSTFYPQSKYSPKTHFQFSENLYS